MSINKALNISLTGLNANQAALNVVSHNIANINTEGYVKQSVNFAEVRTPYNGRNVYNEINSLSGVTISGITNASNQYLNNYYRSQLSPAEAAQAAADAASGLADLTDALSDSGLYASFADFFSAASALNDNPTDYALRLNFVEKAKTIAQKFNTTGASIENYRASVIGDGHSLSSAENSKAGTYVDEINSKIADIAKINSQMTVNSSDASLASKRDTLLADLAGLVNITTSISSNGVANVSIGGITVVKGAEAMGELHINTDASISFVDNDNRVTDISDNVTGGKLGGTLSVKSVIDDTMTNLDTLATAFADEMNRIQLYTSTPPKTIQACAYDRENDELIPATEALFQASDGGTSITASNIKINDAIYNNPDLVAAARLDTNSTTNPTWKKSVGNGDNALEFYSARDDKSIPGLGGFTFEDYISSVSAKVALEYESQQQAADAAGSIADSIKNQILSETGVNLDEELSNMIRYQQAYQASARVFSACVDIYDQLLTLGA